MRSRYTIVFVLFLLPATLFGWGKTGHAIVATLAQEHLSDPVKAQMSALLQGQTMASVASVPDDWAHGTKSTLLPNSDWSGEQ